MPVSAILQAAESVRGPGDHVRHRTVELLLTAGAAIASRGRPADDHPHEPLAVGVRLAADQPAERALQVERPHLVASTVGPGHAPMMAAGPSARTDRRPVPDPYGDRRPTPDPYG